MADEPINVFAMLRDKCVAAYEECSRSQLHKEQASAYRQVVAWIDHLLPPPLKPCPFCGGDDVELEEGAMRVTVHCLSCAVRVRFVHDADDKAATIAGWNSRAKATPDLISAAIFAEDILGAHLRGVLGRYGTSELMKAHAALQAAIRKAEPEAAS